MQISIKLHGSMLFCFCSEMYRGIEETRMNYRKMLYKEALRTGFFEFQVIFNHVLDYNWALLMLAHKMIGLDNTWLTTITSEL